MPPIIGMNGKKAYVNHVYKHSLIEKVRIKMIPVELKEMINEVTAVALEYNAGIDIDFSNGDIKISIYPNGYELPRFNNADD